jgi:hypothetical protein
MSFENRIKLMKKILEYLGQWHIMLLSLFVFVLAMHNNWDRRQRTPPPPQEEVVTRAAVPTIRGSSVPLVAPKAVKANDNDDYKLIVGANIVVNTNQKLSPPTSSVAVTNGEHLRLLREQARQAHQQQTVQK